MSASVERFVASLRAAHDPVELTAVRRRIGPDDEAVGIRMRDVFAAAKAAVAMSLDEVVRLFDSPLYEVRLGALCILDFRAKARRVTVADRERLYCIYLDHHDRITTWDMVDRAAPSVVGGWLSGRDPAPLHTLAADPEPVVTNAVGIALKHAGGRDPQAVVRFLDEYGSALSRPAVRAAVDKLVPDDRERFLPGR